MGPQSMAMVSGFYIAQGLVAALLPPPRAPPLSGLPDSFGERSFGLVNVQTNIWTCGKAMWRSPTSPCPCGEASPRLVNHVEKPRLALCLTVLPFQAAGRRRGGVAAVDGPVTHTLRSFSPYLVPG